MIVELYQLMADHTAPECAKNCRKPHTCCDDSYCGMAQAYAKLRGVELEPIEGSKIRFLGPNGCIVPPNLRPICTLHTCAINSFGFKPGDPAWTQRYFEIRDMIDEEEDRQETSGVFAGTP